MIRNPVSRRTLLAGTASAAALGTAAACGGGGPAGTADDPIEISFEWWGDQVRAEVTKQAIDLFEQKNEGIKVRSNFADYGEYWQSLTGRMASLALPDVFQMDSPRLRQFPASGLLLPLDDLVKTDDFREEELLESGRLDGELQAVPIAGNTTGLLYRADLFSEHGIDAPELGHTWDDYRQLVAEFSAALGDGQWAAEDWASSYLYMEMWLHQQGATFYSEDLNALGFSEEQLKEYWSMPADLLEQALLPSAADAIEWEEDGLVMGTVASALRWDNALSSLAPTVAETGGELRLAPPPTVDPADLGIYLKPSTQLVIAGNTEYEEAAGKFVDFFLHDPEAVALLGTNRGIPATNVGLENVEIDEHSQIILDYEETVKEHLEPAPPAPPSGAGGVELKFMEIYEQVQYGTMPLDEATAQFFTEAEALFQGEQ